ncbi:MAG: hypothetical protein IPJ79_20260 [Bacteroidetes bacterium]|nr:hypothetical protein [Bacteroidota bacterium]
MRRILHTWHQTSHKFMLCAAIAYNLKKYIRFITNKRISVPMQLKTSVTNTTWLVFNNLYLKH